MDRARTALAYAAAIFCSRKTERVPKHPQERRVGTDVNDLSLAVDRDGGHLGIPFVMIRRLEVEMRIEGSCSEHSWLERAEKPSSIYSHEVDSGQERDLSTSALSSSPM